MGLDFITQHPNQVCRFWRSPYHNSDRHPII